MRVARITIGLEVHVLVFLSVFGFYFVRPWHQLFRDAHQTIPQTEFAYFSSFRLELLGRIAIFLFSMFLIFNSEGCGNST